MTHGTLICTRCGRAGHVAASCTRPVSTPCREATAAPAPGEAVPGDALPAARGAALRDGGGGLGDEARPTMTAAHRLAARELGRRLLSHPVANGTIAHTEAAGQLLIEVMDEVDQWREICGQLVACHEEPTCPAVALAIEMLGTSP